MPKLYVHRRNESGKIHTADYWMDRATCGASLTFSVVTSAPVTCKRCKAITYGKGT